MKPAPFEYFAPHSVEEALSLLREHGGDAKLLAGGQSLVPAMNFRVVQPSALIDLNRIGELDYVRQDGGCLRIGAMTRERTLEFEPVVGNWSPLLREAMPHVAHPQIRNRGTLGGSLANADPAAELPVVMLALDARLKVRNIDGERWVDAADFFSGIFTTALEPGDLLVEIELPSQPHSTGWSFLEVAPRAGDYALMGVASQVTVDESAKCSAAKLIFLNAGDGPVVARQAAARLHGEILTEKLLEETAVFASQNEINPFGNIHASPDFQRHLAKVLTIRALQQAFQRAGAVQ
jgi:carbon-monoxide dehydrogenase medium subunit